MTESEYLSRIDRHVAETTRHIAETKDHMARGNELFDRCIRATDDLRQFIREITVRSERVHRAMLAELAAGRREYLDQRYELRELREDSRAQTEALMRMIERLPPRADASGS